MQASSLEELHAMAGRIGLQRAWFQEKLGRPEHDHYDLTRAKRRQAIAAGAVPETWRQAVHRNRLHRRFRQVTEKSAAPESGS